MYHINFKLPRSLSILWACSRSKNSATNEGPGLPSRDRIEIRTGYGAGGGKKIRVFFLKKHPPKNRFYINLNQYCYPHPPAVCTHSVQHAYAPLISQAVYEHIQCVPTLYSLRMLSSDWSRSFWTLSLLYIYWSEVAMTVTINLFFCWFLFWIFYAKKH